MKLLGVLPPSFFFSWELFWFWNSHFSFLQSGTWTFNSWKELCVL